MRIITIAQKQLTKIHIIFKTKNNLKEKNTNTLKIPPKLDVQQQAPQVNYQRLMNNKNVKKGSK